MYWPDHRVRLMVQWEMAFEDKLIITWCFQISCNIALMSFRDASSCSSKFPILFVPAYRATLTHVVILYVKTEVMLENVVAYSCPLFSHSCRNLTPAEWFTSSVVSKSLLFKKFRHCFSHCRLTWASANHSQNWALLISAKVINSS